MDAAVIGVPNEGPRRRGEGRRATGRWRRAFGRKTARELIAFCSEHLARFEVPRSIDFEKELPRLPTGKLYKRLLRDKYWAGHGTAIV